MKGLILKDLYMIKSYCKSYLLIAAVFLAVSLASSENMFFVFYPCLLCGMIPVTLLGYDERSRWIQYSGTMPYTKTQIVSAKYLIGLFSQLIVLILTGVAQSVKMIVNDNFVMSDFTALMLLMLFLSTFSSSISLPFIFKYGVEKGRVAYYCMICFVCAASFWATAALNWERAEGIKPYLILILLAVFGTVVYVFSWYMSVVLYKKREV